MWSLPSLTDSLRGILLHVRWQRPYERGRLPVLLLIACDGRLGLGAGAFELSDRVFGLCVCDGCGEEKGRILAEGANERDLFEELRTEYVRAVFNVRLEITVDLLLFAVCGCCRGLCVLSGDRRDQEK